jgi:hypothetical protein
MVRKKKSGIRDRESGIRQNGYERFARVYHNTSGILLFILS